jgi:hypothetical protein
LQNPEFYNVYSQILIFLEILVKLKVSARCSTAVAVIVGQQLRVEIGIDY